MFDLSNFNGSHPRLMIIGNWPGSIVCKFIVTEIISIERKYHQNGTCSAYIYHTHHDTDQSNQSLDLVHCINLPADPFSNRSYLPAHRME